MHGALLYGVRQVTGVLTDLAGAVLSAIGLTVLYTLAFAAVPGCCCRSRTSGRCWESARAR